MKLSEIKGERTFDVIADCIDPVMNIAMDKKASAFFEQQECPKGQTPREFMLARAKRSIPHLLKNHKADLIAILATINGVTPADYEKNMTLASVIADVTEVLTDEEFSAFLSH